MYIYFYAFICWFLYIYFSWNVEMSISHAINDFYVFKLMFLNSSLKSQCYQTNSSYLLRLRCDFNFKPPSITCNHFNISLNQLNSIWSQVYAIYIKRRKKTTLFLSGYNYICVVFVSNLNFNRSNPFIFIFFFYLKSVGFHFFFALIFKLLYTALLISFDI